MTLNRRRFFAASGAIALTSSAAALALWPEQARTQELSIDAVQFDPDAPVQGNPDGDVTLVEYFDYQCPFCKSMHPVLQDVVAADGNVRLVMKDWPIFGPPSVRASQLALRAVDLGAYVAVSEALMATKARLSDAEVTAAVSQAVSVDAAMSAYQASRDKWDGLLSRNDFQAAALGFRGTPAFAIGTTLYSGALDAATLTEAIAQARAA